MKLFFILTLMGASTAIAQIEQPLWEGKIPGNVTAEKEGFFVEKGVTYLTHVSQPTVTFYPAAASEKPNPVVIICPGGGYNILAYDLEGSEGAEWLNSIGISAVILKYRVPQERKGALKDARQAVRKVRDMAQEWNIDPKRVGMLGFSAGGHLTAACSNSPDRPDFSLLIYPAYLANEGGIELVDEVKLDKNTPPAFVVQTQDDVPYYHSSMAYATALDALGIPVELHLFSKGGHGYGLRPSDHPVSQWPSLCATWMRESGFLD